MRILDHPNVNGLIEVMESNQHFYVVSEYAEHGELFEFISERGPLPTDDALKFFRQMIFGLEYLHSLGIAHRDVKPENLLLDGADNVKIADFGFSRWMKGGVADTSCGSPHYAAPEVLSGESYNGCIADLWSAGVVLFVLVSGRLPFDDTSIRGLLNRIRQGKFRMPGGIDDGVKDLIQGLMTQEPSERWTILRVKEHPAFRRGLTPVYQLPRPLPFPDLSDPMEPPDEDLADTLRLIGVDEWDITEAGSNPAKIFAFVTRTVKRDRFSTLPWDDVDVQEPIAEAALELVTAGEDVAIGRSMMVSASVPGEGSLVEQRIIGPAYERETESRAFRVSEHLDVIVAAAQAALSRDGFKWFHPDQFTLLAQRDDLRLLIEVEAGRDGDLVVRVTQREGLASDGEDAFAQLQAALGGGT